MHSFDGVLNAHAAQKVKRGRSCRESKNTNRIANFLIDSDGNDIAAVVEALVPSANVLVRRSLQRRQFLRHCSMQSSTAVPMSSRAAADGEGPHISFVDYAMKLV